MSVQLRAAFRWRATSAAWPRSSRSSQARTALVGKQRLENVMTSGPPAASTRPRSRSTAAGRVRYWIDTQMAAASNSASAKGRRAFRFRSCTT